MGLLTTEDNGLYVYASPLMDRTKSARSTTIRSLCAVTTSGPSMYRRNQVGRLLEYTGPQELRSQVGEDQVVYTYA